MTGFELGQRVHAADTLYRKESRDEKGRFFRTWVYSSDRYEGWNPKPTPIDGIVVGTRTLYNGQIVYEYDAGAIFSPTLHRQAILIADHLRRKPRFVWVDDVLRGPAGDR